MKRGKRQIIERPNMFGSNDQPQSSQHSNNFNFSTNDWNSLSSPNTEPQKIHVEPIKHQNPQILKKYQNIKPISNQQNLSHHPHPTVLEQRQQTAGDDDRKKRLQMLRQKYLKGGQNQQVKQPQVKQQQKVAKPQQKKIIRNDQKKQKPQKLVQHKQQVVDSNNFFSSLGNQSYENNSVSQKHQKIIKREQQNNVQKQQNEKPISKPTQTFATTEHRKAIPPPPPMHDQKRKKTAPPPVNRIHYAPLVSPERQHQLQSEESIHDKLTPSFPSFNNQNDNHQQINQYEDTQHSQPSNLASETSKGQLNLLQVVNNWLNNSKGAEHQNNYQSKNKILNQLSNNQSVFVRGMIQHFIVSNRQQFSLQQSAFVQKYICQFGAISNLSKLFIAIKCGDQTLIKYLRQFDFIKTLEQLIPAQQYLLDRQKSRFFNFLVNNVIIKQQILPKLVQFAPNCQQIYQYILRNVQLQNPINSALVLCNMKNNITQQMCPTYFKLINFVITQIQNQSTLQAILKLIDNITYQSAYSLKKMTKLKIIQKISSSSTGQTASREQSQFQYDQRNQRDLNKEKSGSGLSNLMGIVNQTFKRIASQIPEKMQNPAQSNNTVSEPPKQTLVYDPVLKRWLINGKVPEDEDGQVEVSSPDNQDKPKKKVPPPPPRASKNNKQISHNNQPTPQHQNRSKQPIYQEKPYNSSIQMSFPTNQYKEKPEPEQDYNFPQLQQTEPKRQYRGAPPPPPSRMGIKGLANKKPKIQAYYP